MSLSQLSGARLKGGTVLGVALISGAFLLGACGSSSNNSGGTTSSSSSSTSSTAAGSTGSSTSSSAAPTGSTGSSTTSSAAGSTGSGANALKSIASKLQSGQNATFDAVYKVTGNSQVATIEVAGEAPSKFAFIVTKPGGTKEDIFGDASTTDICSTATSCLSFASSSGLGSFSSIVDIYTGKFWGQELAGFEAEAAASGAKISSMSVGGQNAECVTYGTTTGGEVCVTDSGVLAYVKDNANSSTFELQSVSSSPAASLFSAPPGATVTSESIP